VEVEVDGAQYEGFLPEKKAGWYRHSVIIQNSNEDVGDTSIIKKCGTIALYKYSYIF